MSQQEDLHGLINQKVKCKNARVLTVIRHDAEGYPARYTEQHPPLLSHRYNMMRFPCQLSTNT